MSKLRHYLDQCRFPSLMALVTAIGWEAAFVVGWLVLSLERMIVSQDSIYTFLSRLPLILQYLIVFPPIEILFSSFLWLTVLGQKRIFRRLILGKDTTAGGKWYGPRFVDFFLASILGTAIVYFMGLLHEPDPLNAFSNMFIPYSGLVVGLAQGGALLRNLRKSDIKLAVPWTLCTWMGILMGISTGIWVIYLIGDQAQYLISECCNGETRFAIFVAGIGVYGAVIGLTVGLVARYVGMREDLPNPVVQPTPPMESANIRLSRLKLWGLWIVVTALGWMAGFLLIHDYYLDWEQVPFAALGYLFKSLLIGGVTGMGLRLVLRYHAPRVSSWTGAPPRGVVPGAMLALFVWWMSFLILFGGYFSETAAYPLLLVFRSSITALVQWLILRPGLPGRGIKWGLFWGLGVWLGLVIGEGIRTIVFSNFHNTSGTVFLNATFIGNSIPGLAVGAITGVILLRLLGSASPQPAPSMAGQSPTPAAIPRNTRIEGYVIGPILAALAWLAPGLIVLVGSGFLPAPLVTGGSVALTINVPASIVGTFGAGLVVTMLLGFLFGPALLNDLYQWALRRSNRWLARQIPLICKTICLAGLGFLLVLTMGIAGIKYNLVKPWFRWYLGPVTHPMAIISAPCPLNVAFNCRDWSDWPFYEVWIHAGNEYGGYYYRLFRIKLENKNGDWVGE